MLFSVDQGMHAHHCTASVVHSHGRDLILTAAHCGPGRNTAFVPQYVKGAKRQPYDVWAVSQVFTDSRWTYTGSGSDYDFAFARVSADSDGVRLEEVTGANQLATTPSWRNMITVIGYPEEDVTDDPDDGRAVVCTTTTSRLSGHRQLRIDCGGFYSGTSGSPWLVDYDPRTGMGEVIGVLGGHQGGGGPDDRISYSPYFADAVHKLYEKATASD